MRRVVVFTPIKDEAHRYLQSSLAWNKSVVDEVFVWDDQSSDESVEIAHSLGAWVEIRPDDVPPLLVDEGRFRQAGWERMVHLLGVEDGDWVLTLDADNFWVGNRPKFVVEELARSHAEAASIDIKEMFRLQPLCERTDGWWGGINEVKLARYNSNEPQEFQRKTMGCASMPLYTLNARRPSPLWELGSQILHYGYAHEDDRQEKYDRYSMLSGHSSEHIESILKHPVLSPWLGDTPDVWRGMK